jgi:tetratricopeptide (TPR) repeat protein
MRESWGRLMPKVAQLPVKRRAPDARVVALRPAAKPLSRYYAFLSYSHKDKAVADWLHRELESFKVPAQLVGTVTEKGTVPPHLRPIFRDEHELAAAVDLGAEIEAALASSQCLIVLCSPSAASSRWTNAEIDTFKRFRPDGHILAAVIDGEPFASDIEGREAEECFPPALRYRYDRRGRATGKRAEPLAADLREGRDGKRHGLLKLVAGMLGVRLDDLVQRDHVRRQKRLAMLTAASLAGMAVTSTLAIWAVQSRDEARDQRREAEGLVGFMLGDLKEKLEPIGRLDALDAVGSRALAYFANQDKSQLSDSALTQRARALTLMGEIAVTRGDLSGALKRYQEAFKSTEEILRRYQNDPQRIFDHAQNVYWVGYIDYLSGDPQSAARRFSEYKRMADQMVQLAPDRKEFKLEQVYANTNLGTVQMEVRQYREAAATYESSLVVADALAAADPRNVDYQKQVVTTLAWLADAHEYAGELDQALGERERQLQLLQMLEKVAPGDTEIQRDTMTARRSIGRLLASVGDVERGREQLVESVQLADALFRIEPENTEWTQANVAARFDLADLLLSTNRSAEAGIAVRSTCDMTNRLVARNSGVSDWKSRLRANCAELRARLALASRDPVQAYALANEALAAANSSPKPLDRGMARFRALALGGNANAQLGENAKARQLWFTALAALPGSIEYRPSELAGIARINQRLGNRDEADRLVNKLSSVGYHYPMSLSSI